MGLPPTPFDARLYRSRDGVAGENTEPPDETMHNEEGPELPTWQSGALRRGERTVYCLTKRCIAVPRAVATRTA
jgi:hypothetical protein